MIRGETKCSLKQFYEKPGVNYHYRDLTVGTCVDIYDKKKNLIYYKNTFLPITSNALSSNVSVYIQEYGFNKIANIVDYRDSDGVKWQKQYTDEGFEIFYKNPLYMCGYKFNWREDSLIHISQRGIRTNIDISNIKSLSVLGGIDFSDRFITENENLIKYFIDNLSDNDLLHKVISFRDQEIQNSILNMYNKGE